MKLSVALAAAGLLLAGCERDAPPQPPASTDEPPAAPEAPPEPALFRSQASMMSTVFQITVAGETDEEAEPAVAEVLREIARLEEVLSEWQPGSEISRINASAGGAAVEVGEDVLAVVGAGLDVSRWSGGAFDLSWAALRGLYGFQPGERRVPSSAEITPRLALIDHEAIELDRAARTVRLGKAGMAIGTGGIAKGYALDRAAAILESHGLHNFMLFGGGQVQVRGQRGDRGWRVGIQHPRKDDYFAFLEVTEGSISTSGDYERFFIDADGRRWHHIIDPDTGRPVEHTLSVTVLAQDGLHGDALSTACFVLGAERCLRMMSEVPGEPQAVIVTSELRVVTTPGLGERLHFSMDLQHGALPR